VDGGGGEPVEVIGDDFSRDRRDGDRNSISRCGTRGGFTLSHGLAITLRFSTADWSTRGSVL
jgi:hypothetical protein